MLNPAEGAQARFCAAQVLALGWNPSSGRVVGRTPRQTGPEDRFHLSGYPSNFATLTDLPLSLAPSARMNGAATFAQASALG